MSQISEDEQLLIEQEKIRNQLKKVPYSILLKQKQQQKMILQQSQDNKKQNKKGKERKNLKKQFLDQQQRNKNIPKQINIYHKPKIKHKQIFQIKQKVAIDPRFQEYTGHLNPDLATKSYSFIDQMQKKQIDQIKNSLHSKRKKLNEIQRQVLQKRYSELRDQTSRQQLNKIEKNVNHHFRQQGYYPKRKEFKNELEHEKMQTIGEKQVNKRNQRKQKKIQKHKNANKSLMYKHMQNNK